LYQGEDIAGIIVELPCLELIHTDELDVGIFRGVCNAGSTEKMIAAFRKGDGDYVHLQGPGPQQLEHDGVGHVVAALADASGTCANDHFARLTAYLDERVVNASNLRLVVLAGIWRTFDNAGHEIDYWSGKQVSTFTPVVYLYSGKIVALEPSVIRVPPAWTNLYRRGKARTPTMTTIRTHRSHLGTSGPSPRSRCSKV